MADEEVREGAETLEAEHADAPAEPAVAGGAAAEVRPGAEPELPAAAPEPAVEAESELPVTEPVLAAETEPQPLATAPAGEAPAATTDLFADDLLGELLETPAPPPGPETPARRLRKGVARTMMAVGLALGLFVILYAIDLIVSAGDVPRGVTVAGVDEINRAVPSVERRSGPRGCQSGRGHGEVSARPPAGG